VRHDNIVEKCLFCSHRVANNLQPYCVEACPSGARVFGNLKDMNGDVAKLLKKHKAFVLKQDEGTKPNVYYIREYSAG